MKTDVQTPQVLFMLPQRLVVPLFQRPYVWNEENQWAPLWRDVERVAERQLSGTAAGQPHFLGAVVLQQMQAPPGTLQVWTIIDGQQRLTTLQLLFDALHAELVAVSAVQPVLRLDPLVANPSAFCQRDEDRFKVWPTNRDRPALWGRCDVDPTPVHVVELDTHRSAASTAAEAATEPAFKGVRGDPRSRLRN